MNRVLAVRSRLGNREKVEEISLLVNTCRIQGVWEGTYYVLLRVGTLRPNYK